MWTDSDTPGFGGAVPRSLQQFPGSFQYSDSLTGRMPIPGLGQLMMMLGGSSILPLPSGNQSILDAMWMRHRNLTGLQIRNNALASMMPFQRLSPGGLNTSSPFFQVGAMFANDPNGFFAKTMSPLIGGNPMAASMNAFANLRGMNMTTFGTTGDIGSNGVSDLNRALSNNFYRMKEVKQADVDSNASDIVKMATLRGMDKNVAEGFNRSFLTKSNEVDASKFSAFKDRLNDFEKNISGEDLTSEGGKGRAKEAAQTFLESITDQSAKDKITKAITDAISKGDTSALTKAMRPIDAYAKDMVTHSLLHEGGRIPNGINFAATYGFNYEDLMKGFTRSVEQNLIGKQSSLTSGLNKFLNEKTGAVAAMDAARSYYGRDMGAGEAMGLMSNAIGVSDIDMSKSSSNAKIENYYRSLKAIGRQLNTDPQEIEGMINEGKHVAANTPGLQYLGGIEMGNLAEQAVTSTAAMAQLYDNTSIRRMGGTRGMMEHLLAGRLQNANEPISQQLAALYTFAGNQGNTKTQELVKSYMGTLGGFDLGNGLTVDHSQRGLNTFISSMSQNLGVNPYQLGSYIRNNSAATAQGYSDLLSKDPTFDIGLAGKNAKAEAFLSQLVLNNPSGQGKANVSAFIRSYMNNGDERLNISKRLQQSGITDKNLLGMAQQMDSEGVSEVFLNKYNSGYGSKVGLIKKQLGEDKALEKNLSKYYGFLNAPLTTTLVNQLYSGAASKQGISAFANAVMDSNGTDLANSLMGVNKLNASEGISTITDVLQGSSATGGIGMFGGVKNLSGEFGKLIALSNTYGINGAQLQQYRKGDGAERKRLREGWASARGIKDVDKFTLSLNSAASFVGNNESEMFAGIKGNFDENSIKQAASHAAVAAQMEKIRAHLLEPVDATIKSHVSDILGATSGYDKSQKDFLSMMNDNGFLDSRHLLMMKDGFDTYGNAKNDEVKRMVKRIKDSGLVKSEDGAPLSDQGLISEASGKVDTLLNNDVKQALGVDDLVSNVLKTGDKKEEDTPALLGNILETLRSMVSGMDGVKGAIDTLATKI